jgi:AcrR family transcriptional regulator
VKEGANGAHELAVDCIYTALLQLMQTKPYRDISITEITRRAGVSRMAYYRNYADKDDILLRRLEDRFLRVEAILKESSDLSERDAWEQVVSTLLNEPIMESILAARLMDKAFPVVKDILIRVYASLFYWNPGDEDAMFLFYQRLGSLFGFLMYAIEQKHRLSTSTLVRHLMALAADGEKR